MPNFNFIILENVKTNLRRRSGRKSCRVRMTVLLSFDEKADDVRACA